MKSHTRETTYQCSMCDKAFPIYSKLTIHIRTHTGEKLYKCNVCEKLFVRKGHCDQHMQTHTGDRPYKCPKCDKAFSFKSCLTTHIGTHTGEKPYKCDICEKSFTFKSNLIRHMKTHIGEKMYECSTWDKFQKSCLINDFKNLPTENTCIVCSRLFSCEDFLITHLCAHSTPTQTCAICNAVIKSASMKTHIKKHFSEIITHGNQCPTCNEIFAR